jgi:hypothetical protein
LNKKIEILLILISILTLMKFWIDIYSHDEFAKNQVFIKHRPIWETHFYSPRGMSDLKLLEISEKGQREQILFNEFIVNNQTIE